MSESRFTDQVAIVTGGASGIGRSISERLGREGARVAVLDRDRPALESAVADLAAAAEGVSVTGHPVDVADEGSVRGVVAEVARRHGRLDILVHCAGIVGPNAKRITEVSVEDFDRVYRVNLRGAFLMTRYALGEMAKAGYGRILLFASIAGKEGNAGMCAYSATKAGVIGLVKSAGKEFAETGITVNAIAPAVIRTAMVEAMAPSQVKYMTDRIPMKRTGTLEEITALSCWIVSRAASFTTAFTYDLSGGRATY